MPGPIHVLCTAGQLQGIKVRSIKGGDNSMYCFMHPHMLLLGAEAVMKEHLVRKRPKPAEPFQFFHLCM